MNEEKLTVCNFITDKLNVRNGMNFMIMAIACSFCYYLINFYVKYLPGSIYTNQLVNSLSESTAHALSAVVVQCLSVKKGFGFAYLSCILASLMVIFAEMY